MENEIPLNNISATPTAVNPTYALVPEHKSKKFGIMIVILLVVIVTSAFFWWKTRNVDDGVVSDVAKEQLIVNKEKQWKAVLNQVAGVDKDFDNLTDVEESQYGTDASKPDTDADGLLDGDEIKIHKTDPQKADTDSDGVKDGRELKNGTNPLKK